MASSDFGRRSRFADIPRQLLPDDRGLVSRLGRLLNRGTGPLLRWQGWLCKP